MKTSNEGGFSALITPLVISVLLAIGAAVFGFWAYGKMLDYKNNTDAKVATAVQAAKQQEDTVKDAAFAEAQKNPLSKYTGPGTYGSVSVSYPRTWSAYVADDSVGSPYVDGYFNPSVVPDIRGQNSAFALRIQVVQQSYSTTLTSLTSFVQSGTAKVSPYHLPKVPNVIGVRVDGKLDTLRSGSMVILPLRNMTLKIWTETPSTQSDFNNIILPNFTFAP
jgi:hypothetical protein